MENEKNHSFDAYKLTQLIEYRKDLEEAKAVLETLEKIYPKLVKNCCIAYCGTVMRSSVYRYLTALEEVRNLSAYIESEISEM